jgi:hypothetical protein
MQCQPLEELTSAPGGFVSTAKASVEPLVILAQPDIMAISKATGIRESKPISFIEAPSKTKNHKCSLQN